MNCKCCDNGLEPYFKTPEVLAFRCTFCGSLKLDHPPRPEQEDPWRMASVTPQFLEALRYRRSVQAKSILQFIRKELGQGKLLDYGCGQGAFVEFLLKNQVDAYGCDISYSNVESSALGDRFHQLPEPWSMPLGERFNMVSLLDVIEHAENPNLVIEGIRELSPEFVVVKVPMLHGPIGKLAQLIARAGKVGLLERLLLVGEISPHYTFFSSLGIKRLFERNGFSLVRTRRIADVGSELPNRLRGKPGEPQLPAKNFLARVTGYTLSLLAPFWSDTRIFLFMRTQQEELTSKRLVA